MDFLDSIFLRICIGYYILAVFNAAEQFMNLSDACVIIEKSRTYTSACSAKQYFVHTFIFAISCKNRLESNHDIIEVEIRFLAIDHILESNCPNICALAGKFLISLFLSMGCRIKFRGFGQGTVSIVILVISDVLYERKEKARKDAVIARNHDEGDIVAIRFIRTVR